MIIQHAGTPRPKHPWVGRYLCNHCGSVIDLTDDDAGLVFKWRDDQRDGMSVNIACPICREERSVVDFKHTITYQDNRKYWDKIPFGFGTPEATDDPA